MSEIIAQIISLTFMETENL